MNKWKNIQTEFMHFWGGYAKISKIFLKTLEEISVYYAGTVLEIVPIFTKLSEKQRPSLLSYSKPG